MLKAPNVWLEPFRDCLNSWKIIFFSHKSVVSVIYEPCPEICGFSSAPELQPGSEWAPRWLPRPSEVLRWRRRPPPQRPLREQEQKRCWSITCSQQQSWDSEELTCDAAVFGAGLRVHCDGHSTVFVSGHWTGRLWFRCSASGLLPSHLLSQQGRSIRLTNRATITTCHYPFICWVFSQSDIFNMLLLSN